jgi:hypothetical protein
MSAILRISVYLRVRSLDAFRTAAMTTATTVPTATGCVPRERFDPADVELLPGNQGGPRSLKRGFAVPNHDSRLVVVFTYGVGFDDS